MFSQVLIFGLTKKMILKSYLAKTNVDAAAQNLKPYQQKLKW